MIDRMDPLPEPQIDVALATFNGARFLPEFLESLLHQSRTNWHIYAGDDGSTDATAQILESFYTRYPDRITLLPPGNRLGAKANFSRILCACRSDYVLLADQDDIWLPKKIEILLKRILTTEKEYRANTPILVHSDLTVIDPAGNEISPSFWRYQHISPNYGKVLKNCMIQNTVTGCACILNRALLETALPVPETAIMHDWWLALTASALGTIDHLSTPLVQYRQHAANAIGQKKWGVARILSEICSGRESLHERIRRTELQAGSFLNRFADKLNCGDLTLLEAFSTLEHLPPLKKRKVALLYRLRKCGLVRTAGFYVAL